MPKKPSQSRYYFSSKTKNIRRYTRLMYKDIEKELNNLLENAPDEQFAFYQYMESNKFSYNQKCKKIVDKYEKLILLERSKNLNIVGKEVGFNEVGAPKWK